MRTRRKRYSAEFKREALKRACEEGMTIIGVSVKNIEVCQKKIEIFTLTPNIDKKKRAAL
jgi:hypothetical protein